MPATISSIGVVGARNSRAANVGAGSALRSSLPEVFSGNSASTTIAAGTMYDGSVRVTNAITSPASTSWPGAGTT
ncbi:hypothetical protein AIIKEEIJ_02140 [Rhodococcus sp. YH1]|nr:hypothetical protein [Rhodococcus sp. YH1]